jgi:uncharacterized protein (DUF1697 family)
MSRYIAFLRAINVGGRVVKMDVLRSIFESLRFRNVETFIASGNVIFETSGSDPGALEQRIEESLRQKLGYEVATFLRTPAEVRAIAAHRPFDEEGVALMIAFLKRVPAAAGRSKLLAMKTDWDEFHFRGRELYWLVRVRSSDSKFSNAVLEKTLAMPSTVRNVTTVRRLAEKYQD